MRKWKSILFPALLLLLIRCTSNFPDDEPPVNPDNPNGLFYVNVVGDFMKLDASTDSVYWKSGVLNLFNSSGNPMVFDSNYFYHGNYTSLTCYSAVTGLPVWTNSWLAFSDAITYREPAFNDSSIFFTSPTSVWDHGYLYCKNKRTGAARWEKKIDFGNVYNNFNGIPIVYGDRVITLTRDNNDQQYLTAFAVQTGDQAWSVPVSPTMRSKLSLLNGKIYSAFGPEALCYDASNGQLLWQKDLGVATAWWTHNFFDNDKLVVVKVLSNSQYKVLQLRKDNGDILQSQDLVVITSYAQNNQIISPTGCEVRSNRLYITSVNTIDSIDLFCYDLNNLSRKWKTTLENSLFTRQAPVLTDKYLVLPTNDQYDTPNQARSNMVFLDLSGKLVKKVPFNSVYTDGFVYKENGVLYRQSFHY